MFKNISVYNFKGLHKLENVALDKITLIGGKNNSGKSSLLESLFLYIDRRTQEVFAKLLAWRNFSSIQISPASLWAPFFYNTSLSNDIVIEIIDSNGKHCRLQLKNEENYSHKGTFPIPITAREMAPLVSMSADGNFHALSVTHTTDKVPDLTGHFLMHSGCMYDEIQSNAPVPSVFFMGFAMILNKGNAELLGKLDKNEEQEKVLPLLRRFEPELQRLQLIKEGQSDVIYADLGNKRKIPVNELGDGFCRCLTIALLLAAGNYDLLLLDEVGNGIHYSLLPKLWQFLIDATKAYNCQLITTTHSYEMINALGETCKKEAFKDISYIRLAKQNEEVAAHQFTFDDLSSALASELEVR